MIFNGFFSKTTKICLNLPINLFSNLQLAAGYSALWQRPAGPVQSPVFRSESSQRRQRPGRFFQPDRCAKFLWPWSWRGNHGAWICVFWLAKFNAYLRSARVAARCLTAIQRPDQVRGSSVQKRLWSRVLWRFQCVHGADQSDHEGCAAGAWMVRLAVSARSQAWEILFSVLLQHWRVWLHFQISIGLYYQELLGQMQ